MTTLYNYIASAVVWAYDVARDAVDDFWHGTSVRTKWVAVVLAVILFAL